MGAQGTPPGAARGGGELAAGAARGGDDGARLAEGVAASRQVCRAARRLLPPGAIRGPGRGSATGGPCHLRVHRRPLPSGDAGRDRCGRIQLRAPAPRLKGIRFDGGDPVAPGGTPAGAPLVLDRAATPARRVRLRPMTVQGESLLGRIRAPLRGTPVHLAWRYLASAVDARRRGAVLDGVGTYCLFIGHARSGHSVIGALLDAHPRIAISDELDALTYAAAGFSRRQILSLSIAVARGQARRQRRKAGRGGAMYSYFVPGQFQGRHKGLAVV